MSRFERDALRTQYLVTIDRIATETHLALLENLPVLDEIGFNDHLSWRRETSTIGDIVETSSKQRVTINRVAEETVHWRDFSNWRDFDALVETVPPKVAGKLAAQIDSDLRVAITDAGDPTRVAFASALHGASTFSIHGFVKTYGDISMSTSVTYDISKCSDAWTFHVMYGIGVEE